MLMDEYFSAMKNVLTKAENTQRETILAAPMNCESPGKRRRMAYYGHRAYVDV